VHLLCRNRERGEAARREIAAATGNPSVHLHVVDVSDAASVRAFAEAWNASGAPVHALINNAGVLPAERTLTREGHEAGWATMMMQSYLLTGLLIPVSVAYSRAGAWGDDRAAEIALLQLRRGWLLVNAASHGQRQGGVPAIDEEVCLPSTCLTHQIP
jgi:NAD(P)-dependent dehydrogenase (short-subunit alcohol dehydrogenase family)